VLYNWPAVMTEGVCPSHWHIPSTYDNTQLSDNFGGNNFSGGALKESGTNHWNPPNTGATNSSGFTAIPGGYRNINGYYFKGEQAYWWSSTESGSIEWNGSLNSIYVASLHYAQDGLSYTYYPRWQAFSARCVRDD
jgi:uncharacterized protein (TIGR02145 family)